MTEEIEVTNFKADNEISVISDAFTIKYLIINPKEMTDKPLDSSVILSYHLFSICYVF